MDNYENGESINVYLTDNTNTYLFDKLGVYLTTSNNKENDIMANTKKYVSFDKLSLYDEKIKKYLADADTAALDSAKEYADGLAVNYEAAGTVATAQAALQKNIDAVAEDVAAIAEDYLKAADAEALQKNIDAKADQTALDAVSAVANAAATQTALQGEIERATNAEAGLQTQINTIMNNPDTEGVINSINEFTQYISDHGEIAEGFRTDIDANKKAIEDHETLAAQTYETKEDATAKYDEVKAEIAAIPQADWAQNDPAAADYVKNRTHYESGEQTVLFEDDLGNLKDGSMGERYFRRELEFFDSLPDVSELKCEVDGAVYECTQLDDNHYRFVNVLINGKKNNINIIAYSGNNYTDITFDYLYGEDVSGKTFRLLAGEVTIKQLDEKFIPDTIARVADVDAKLTEANGYTDTEVAKVQGEVDALEELVGVLPEGATATTVVGYIDAKTANIASNETVNAIDKRVADIEADYLKAVDKQELTEAIAAIPQADWNQNDETAADYVKNRTHYASETIVDEFVGLVSTSSTDTKPGSDGGTYYGTMHSGISYPSFEVGELCIVTVDGVEYELEVNQYRELGDTSFAECPVMIRSGGYSALVIGTKNPNETHTVSLQRVVSELKQLDEKFIPDTIARVTDVDATIAAIPQADWNQNDPDAADYVKNRTHYEDGEQTLISTIPLTDVHSGSMGAMYAYIPNVDEFVAELDPNAEYQVSVNGKTYALIKDFESDGRIRGLTAFDIEIANGQTIGLSIYPTAVDFNGKLNLSNAYGLDLSSYTVNIYKGSITIKQLDEKFIPGAIARVADVDATLAVAKTELEGKIDTKADASALTAAVEALGGADAAMSGRLDAIEAQLGDGEGSVAEQIAGVKAELQGELAQAIADAKTDAANKDAVVLAEAQQASAAVQAVLDTHTNNGDIHVTAEQKTAWTTAAGKAHEHSNYDVLEGITASKVAAWDAAEGNAKTYADGLNTAMDTRVASIETWHSNFVEVSEEEINSLFA